MCLPAVSFENSSIYTFEMNQMISRMFLENKYNDMVHYVLYFIQTLM